MEADVPKQDVSLRAQPQPKSVSASFLVTAPQQRAPRAASLEVVFTLVRCLSSSFFEQCLLLREPQHEGTHRQVPSAGASIISSLFFYTHLSVYMLVGFPVAIHIVFMIAYHLDRGFSR